MTQTDKQALAILIPAICVVLVAVYFWPSRPFDQPKPISPHHMDVTASTQVVEDVSATIQKLTDHKNYAVTDRDRISRITCYGPPDYPNEAITASGMTVAQARMLATSMKLDGICAISWDWRQEWNRVETGDYAQLCIRNGQAQGVYLVVDRTAKRLRNVVDVWYDGEGQWKYQSRVICINPLTTPVPMLVPNDLEDEK